MRIPSKMAINPSALAGTAAGSGLLPSPQGGLIPSRVALGSLAPLPIADAHRAFREFVLQEDFPCVGARAAFNTGSYALAAYDELGSSAATAALAQDLLEFTQSEIRQTSEYATFAAIFRGPLGADEKEFERTFWSQLESLNQSDAKKFGWDPHVRSDPTDPQFSFSFAGQALYVIGLHPQSSRLARRFRWPAMVFNPHEQFERLRADGKWKRMQQTIRERDVQLQGSVNPMLSDFGDTTEARQYSGRAVEDDWHAPFQAATGKCPFGH